MFSMQCEEGSDLTQNLTNIVNSQNQPKFIQIYVFYPKKQATLSIFSIKCEEGYQMNKFSKFQSIVCNSFHVSDLNAKLNNYVQFSKSTKIHPNLCFYPKKQATLGIKCEEGYQMNKFIKFQSIRFDSFLVSDLNT